MEDMILFNGRSSTDFEMIVTEYPVLSRGVRRGDAYQIAGRNGTQIREDGTFDNYTMTYKVSFPEEDGPSATTAEIAEWLLGSSGYCRLEDSFEPDYYRLARYAGPLNITQLLDQYGTAPLSFDCQPERFLKTGETTITALEDVHSLEHEIFYLDNPTGMVARPLIRVTGYGGIQFAVHPEGAAPLVIRTATGTTRQTILIDCDTYAVTYADGTDASSDMTFVDSEGYPEFPTLQAGTTVIENIPFNGGGLIESLEIVPRWWSL